MKTIIINATVLTMDAEDHMWSQGYVSFEHDKILAAGPMDDIGDLSDYDEVLDACHGILMPGMVNLHTHMGMIPFRGLGDDCKDRLRTFLFPMEQKAMGPELVYLSTGYAAAEMLLSGTTCVFDMYYYESEAARALDEMGMRGFAAQTIMEAETCDAGDPGQSLAAGEDLIQKYQNHPRIRGCVAPHGTHTCSPDTLIAAHALDQANGLPFSLHAAEMDYEIDYFRQEYGETPIAFLDRIGVLDQRTLAAHCIFMDEADIRLFHGQGASVAHCIGSNTKAGKGVAPVLKMRAAGVLTGLGTDGPASGNTLDLFTQMRMTANFHKTANHDRSVFPARDIVRMATIDGARSLGLHGSVGSIEQGKQADLVLVETESANMFPVFDPYSALVYSANPSNVSHVFVDGICLVRDKQLTGHSLADMKKRLSDAMRRTAFHDYFLF